MGETPLRNLKPVILSHHDLVRSGWAGWKRSSILCTQDMDSGLSEAIVACESEILGAPASFSHAMRYLGRDQVLDQQEKLQVRTLEDYVGYIVRRYSNPLYSEAQLNKIVAEAMVFHGREYDFWAIGGHLAEAILGVDGLAERVHSDDRMYCSEGVCYHERFADPYFMGEHPCQVMPAEIDDYCIEAGWEIATFLLVE